MCVKVAQPLTTNMWHLFMLDFLLVALLLVDWKKNLLTVIVWLVWYIFLLLNFLQQQLNNHYFKMCWHCDDFEHQHFCVISLVKVRISIKRYDSKVIVILFINICIFYVLFTEHLLRPLIEPLYSLQINQDGQNNSGCGKTNIGFSRYKQNSAARCIGLPSIETTKLHTKYSAEIVITLI